jgi:hypothetical protein
VSDRRRVARTVVRIGKVRSRSAHYELTKFVEV